MKELVFRIISFVILWRFTAFAFRTYNSNISELNERIANLERQNKLYLKFFEKLISALEKK